MQIWLKKQNKTNKQKFQEYCFMYDYFLFVFVLLLLLLLFALMSALALLKYVSLDISVVV